MRRVIRLIVEHQLGGDGAVERLFPPATRAMARLLHQPGPDQAPEVEVERVGRTAQSRRQLGDRDRTQLRQHIHNLLSRPRCQRPQLCRNSYHVARGFLHEVNRTLIETLIKYSMTVLAIELGPVAAKPVRITSSKIRQRAQRLAAKNCQDSW